MAAKKLQKIVRTKPKQQSAQDFGKVRFRALQLEGKLERKEIRVSPRIRTELLRELKYADAIFSQKHTQQAMDDYVRNVAPIFRKFLENVK